MFNYLVFRNSSSGTTSNGLSGDRSCSPIWSISSGEELPRNFAASWIPTLVIYGDHEFIPAATAEHITEAIPNARMATLNDCGHFSYLECPVAVREQIDTFFRGKMRPARPQ